MVNIISPAVLIAAYVAIISLAVYMSYTTNEYTKFEGGKLKIFLAVVGGLGTLVTFMFYYNLVMIQNNQVEKDRLTAQDDLNQRLSIDLVDEIRQATPIIPEFVRSITVLTRPLNTPELSAVVSATAESSASASVVDATTLALATKIFYLWDSFVSDSQSASREAVQSYVYLAAFLQHAYSTQLERYWDQLKVMIRPTGQQFGDLLFREAAKLRAEPEVTPKLFEQTARELALSPEYLRIITSNRPWILPESVDERHLNYCG